MPDMQKIAQLFAGWDKAMIVSCLQGRMGYVIADSQENPSSALLVQGDICFFAGKPYIELVQRATAPIMVPKDEGWCEAIEAAWGNRAYKTLRYAIKKEPDIFDRDMLAAYANSLPHGFTMQNIDRKVYPLIMQEEWSKDLCARFADYDDYEQNGIGVAVLYQDEPVAGTSSYAVYNGGVEIEIDTKPEFRRRGLATACGAQFILNCLDRGLYPAWDAHDLRSVALAEKLGYHRQGPYTAYIKE